jgi:hypothetical protein
MRITYYALGDIRVGDEVRQAGDLVPEAQMWPYLSGYISEGKIAPVLVATLPEEQQVMLLEWEEEVLGVTEENIPEAEKTPVEPAPVEPESEEKPKTEAKDKPKAQTAKVK